MNKNKYLKFFALFLCMILPWGVKAQSNLGDNPSIKELQKGVKIWEVGGFINHQKFFVPNMNGFETVRNTEINVDMKHIRLINSKIGLGVRGFGSLFIADGFDAVDLGYLAIGPITRFFIYENEALNLYADASYLIGYNITLNDAFGSDSNENTRFRTSLRLGSLYRVSNNLGVFFEVGPDWEGDFPGIETNAKAIQVALGIQLFKF